MSLIKTITALILVILGGFYGIIFFFADMGPGETWASRFLVAFIYYLVFGVVINLLERPKWKFSLFLVYGVVLVALLNLRTAATEGLQSQLEGLTMVAIPLLAVLTSIFVVKKSKKIFKKNTPHGKPSLTPHL